MLHRSGLAASIGGLTLATTALLMLLVLLPALPVYSSPSPVPVPSDSLLHGVVWSPPSAPDSALEQLHAIHDAGATAVRFTSLPPADTIFARADSLNLRLFVDLPVSYVSASALPDSLSQNEPLLDRLRTLAERHPSLRYVGLARHSDTSVPTACTVLDDWDRRLTESSSLQSYYVTPFASSDDRCDDATDLTLLDMRAHPDPVARWTQWDGDLRQTGVGALGTWVHPEADSGLKVPHSAEQQARYLETSLTHLLDSLDTPPPVLFTYRWQDASDSALSFRRYGLHDARGTRRPAADVAQGVYTGTQRVFAFPSGTPPSPTPHRFILIGWGLIALLAGLYAQSPFVRKSVFRYFLAHGFYQDAARKGRNVSLGVNLTLLLVVALTVGIITALLSRIGAVQPSTEHVAAALPSALSTPLAAGLAHPGLAGIVVGAGTAVLLVLWALGLVFVAQWNGRFSLAQGFLLVSWPFWPVLVGLVGALVTATNPPVSTGLLGMLLVAGGLGTLVVSTVRVLYDYKQVTDLPSLPVIGLGGLSPLFLLTLSSLYIIAQFDLPLSFLWHLLTRT